MKKEWATYPFAKKNNSGTELFKTLVHQSDDFRRILSSSV